MNALACGFVSSVFGGRLRQGRLMRGYSLRGLSQALGGRVSHAALQKYEKGQMIPDSTVLIAISETLRLRPDYFFQQNVIRLHGIEFRKRSRCSRKQQDQAIEAARDFMERYLEVEDILGIQPPELCPVDLRDHGPDLLGEAVESVAERLRDAWRLGLDPLPNVQETLEDHGVKALEIEADQDFDGLSGWANHTPMIVLASWLNADLPRKRLTTVHELGHLAMRLPEGMDQKAEEAASYRFAGAMLIPRERLQEEFGPLRRSGQVSQMELVAMKEQWGVSMGAIMRRARDLNLVSADHYRRFCMAMKSSGQWTREPGEWVGVERSQRFRQLVHRAVALELMTASKAAGLLGISLREFDKEFGKAE